MSPEAQPRFYFDFASPDAWLAIERVLDVLGTVPELIPVDARGLTAGEVGPFRCEAEVDAYFEDVGRRAAAYGLLALRRPPGFPPDTGFALRAATYAKQIGKVAAFSLALFRQAYAGGRDIADRDTVFLAGAAAEIHPAALTKGAELRGTTERLRAATEAAAAAGVLDVPAVIAGGRVFHGDAELGRAGQELA